MQMKVPVKNQLTEIYLIGKLIILAGGISSRMKNSSLSENHVDLKLIEDAKKKSKEGDELELLSLLIDKYEKEKYPIDYPDPIEAIKIRMEEMHLKQIDLVNEIGGKSRVSEILNRKRKLTVDMIRKLNRRLNLSPELLINDYQLTR